MIELWENRGRKRGYSDEKSSEGCTPELADYPVARSLGWDSTAGVFSYTAMGRERKDTPDGGMLLHACHAYLCTRTDVLH